jgi:hypothetical protein
MARSGDDDRLFVGVSGRVRNRLPELSGELVAVLQTLLTAPGIEPVVHADGVYTDPVDQEFWALTTGADVLAGVAAERARAADLVATETLTYDDLDVVVRALNTVRLRVVADGRGSADRHLADVLAVVVDDGTATLLAAP